MACACRDDRGGGREGGQDIYDANSTSFVWGFPRHRHDPSLPEDSPFTARSEGCASIC
ncbi:MAG: hypothetical protein ACLUFV_00060 [Acutalibacteraceae bacterium]